MRLLFFAIAISIFLIGCSVGNDDTYNGQSLHIGVIGESPNVNFNNITFHHTIPDLLYKEEYDAYFITEAYFEELSTDEWTSVFDKLHTPVFFINLDVQAFIYRIDGMDYDKTSPKATEHTKGFVRVGDEFRGWAYGDPSGTTKQSDTPKWIYNAIFRDIEEFLQENESMNNNW
nr:hypothetical protein [Lysinibacillus timonensis]